MDSFIEETSVVGVILVLSSRGRQISSLSSCRVQLNEAQDEIMKKRELLENFQHDNSQTCMPAPNQSVVATITAVEQGESCLLVALKVDELMAALKKKDDDMRAMEERYKMYLEKARNVSDDCLGVLVLTPADRLWNPFPLSPR